jgi:dolichyl-diphosphooligosaccharide--protein glycosyltransferase
MNPHLFRLAAGLLVLLAVGVRSLEWPLVFPGDGRVWLDPFDGAYRARRALYTFEHFPALLRFDPYLAYPTGAAVPAPPLYDWLLGATARAFGRDTATFERVAAWAAPTLSGVTVLPIAAAGRALAGPALGLAAAALFALLPVSANFSRVGDPDHHAAVALLGALLLAQTLALARGAPPRRAAALWCALAATRAALVLAWSGSLLYVAVADGVLLGLGVLAGRGWLAAHAAGLAAGALLLAPAAAAEVAAGGRALTSTTFSWLQVGVLAGLAALAGALAAAERAWPSRGATTRAARVVALGSLALGALIALPATRAALLPAAAFLAREDQWGHLNLEQRPLFAFLTRTPLVHGRPASELYGGFALLIPLAPLAALARARDPAHRRAALALAGWSGALGALAIAQVRFGSDYAPSGALALALLLAQARGALAHRLPPGRAGGHLASAAALGAGAALLWPALSASHLPAAQRALSYARVPGLARAYLERSGVGSLRRFAERLRAAAPEPEAERDAFARPPFGVLAPPNYGYALQYFARRATPASNAGPYLDPLRYLAVQDFYVTTSPQRALAIARALQTPYVMTEEHGGLDPASLAYRLQREAGSAEGGRAHLAHFRLLDEGPEGGRPLFFQFRGPPPKGAPPYRLFEVVEGAVLAVPAPPGELAQAELALRSPLARTLVFRARARAGADGIARLRVPHPTHADSPVRAAGAWRVLAGGREWRVDVSLAEVREGAVVAVGGARPGPPQIRGKPGV